MGGTFCYAWQIPRYSSSPRGKGAKIDEKTKDDFHIGFFVQSMRL